MVQQQMAQAVGGSADGHRLVHDNRKPPAGQTLAAAGVGAGAVLFWVPAVATNAGGSEAAAGKRLFARGMAQQSAD